METTGREIDDLQKELAALVRVRNRLAQTPNDSLPKVLHGLAPRLLRRLDRTTLALIQDGSQITKALRERCLSHLTGMLSHCIERIKGNRDLKAPWVLPIIEASAEFETNVTLTLGLSLLKQGLPSYAGNEGSVHAIMPFLLRLLDRLGQRLRCDNTSSNQSHYRLAGWLLLDSISLCFKMPTRVDWTTERFEPVKWNELECMSVSASVEEIHATRNDGCGSMNLFLDTILFWPPRRVRGFGLHGADNVTGLSVDGLARMNSRGKEFDDLYLLQLKYVCVRFAIHPPGKGLLSGDSVAADRAILLAVLASSENTMHGRLALGCLKQEESKRKYRSLTAKNASNPYFCSLALVCSLLVLILGDEASLPVLQGYPDEALAVQAILGPRPAPDASSSHRSPLAQAVAYRATSFIRDQFRPAGAQIAVENKLVQLAVDLIVAIQDPRHHGVYWGIQLIRGIYEELYKSGRRDEWALNFYLRCVDTARAVLSSVPTDDPERNLQTQRRMPGERAPEARLGHEERLIRDHRAAQRKRSSQAPYAVNARDTSYRMIAELSVLLTEEHCSSELLSMIDLAASLFNWASLEEERGSPSLIRAMEAVLNNVRTSAADGVDARVERILPMIIAASCSDSLTARHLAVQWCEGLLVDLDAEAALHICSFLSNDYDNRVAKTARAVVIRVRMTADRATSIRKQLWPRLSFLDATAPQGKRAIRDDLEASTRAIEGLGFTSEIARVVLLHFECDQTSAIDALSSAKEETLCSCGVANRHNTGDVGFADVPDFRNGVFCGICYDTVMTTADDANEAYALPCKHSFCRGCWSDYVGDWADSSNEVGLRILSCPQHDCSERLVSSDIESLRPDLLERHDELMLQQFVLKSQVYQHCPGPDCTIVARTCHTSEHELTSGSSCRCPHCSTSFCSGCGEKPHEPAGCEDFETWNRIFQSSSYWVKKHSKPCPMCKVPIEKNKGCNHMVCSQCGANFCWLCLSHMRSHNEVHICNAYDAVASAEDDSERRALFYTGRFQAHEEAGQFAEQQLAYLDDEAKVSKAFWFATGENIESLESAIRTIVGARMFLRHSYIAAWSIGSRGSEPGTEENRKLRQRRETFESHQATLEVVTEHLSNLTNRNLEPVYEEQGRRGIDWHFRSMDFLAHTVTQYIQRIRGLPV